MNFSRTSHPSQNYLHVTNTVLDNTHMKILGETGKIQAIKSLADERYSGHKKQKITLMNETKREHRTWTKMERDIFMAVTLVYNLLKFFSCMYITTNSVFSMSKMRSQQTHVYARNMMHTVLTDTLVDYQTILDWDQLH